ncbi:MAG: hypothetical protein PVF83_04175 [Anaerolineales bacterium]|jgi:WD40 repeat protein
MKRFYLLFCVALSLVFLASGCGLLSPATEAVPPQTGEQPSGPTGETADGAQYEVVYMENPQTDDTDVYIQDVDTKTMELFATIPDVYVQHYHSSEYHNGSLYIVRRTGDIDTDAWNDELWKYDELRSGTMLYAIKGLDFRVSPDEAYVAVSGGDETVGEKLVILDNQGSLLQEYTPDQVLTGPADMPVMVGLIDWSDDGTALWMETDGPVIASYGRLLVPSWQVNVFDLSGVPIGRAENELNPNTAKVVFSDLPMFFAADQHDEFVASGEAVTLYIYDLATQNLQEIAVSKAEEFEPRWLDDTTIEYNDPVGDGRLLASAP